MSPDHRSVLLSTATVMTLTELVSVNSASPGSGASAYERALFAAGDTANSGARDTCSGNRQLIAVLSPKGTLMSPMRRLS